MANEEQVKIKAKDIGGQVKEEASVAMANNEMKRDGEADQAEDNIQNDVGDANDQL